MMDWTDRYCRSFHRRLTRKAVLYSEMVTSAAVVFGDRQQLIGFDACEHPVVLQLGGSDPAQLAQAAKIAQEFGYDAVNLNVGCPSDRVKSGNFGAALMATPQLVADCFAAMASAVSIPVSIKCRIGIDDQDERQDLERFVQTVSRAGCTTFIVHARKAWLKGLSPKENRDIPPLNYPRVYRLKQDHPDLEIHINGAIASLAEARRHLEHVDGVMMGRAAYHQPYELAGVDEAFYGRPGPAASRIAAVEQMFDFVERETARGVRLAQITRHMLGLFHGQPGARLWRRHLSENAWKPGAGVQTLQDALSFVNRP